MTALLDTEINPHWEARAACVGRDPEIWFRSDTAQAQAICARCPVSALCESKAVALRVTDGVWAGQPINLPAKTVPKEPPRHGTEARARWDQYRGIKPCQECRDAAQRAHRAREKFNEQVPEKKCTGCGVIKPKEQFSPKAGTRDGLTSKCKDCKRAAYAIWYKTKGRARRGFAGPAS